MDSNHKKNENSVEQPNETPNQGKFKLITVSFREEWGFDVLNNPIVLCRNYQAVVSVKMARKWFDETKEESLRLLLEKESQIK